MRWLFLILGLLLLTGCTISVPNVDVNTINNINNSPIIRVITINETDTLVNTIIPDTIIANTTRPVLAGADFQVLRTPLRTLGAAGVEIVIIDPYAANLSSEQIRQFEGDVYAILSLTTLDRREPFFNETWRVGKPNFITHRSGETYDILYWDRDFQELILDEVQRLSSFGYDGVYLRGVGEYRKFDDFRRAEMKEFIRAVYNNGNVVRDDFTIIVEDAPELILDGSYSLYISGYAQGEVWYQSSRPAPFEERDRELSLLQLAKREGKEVYVVEYAQPNNAVCDFYMRCRDEGFHCSVTTKDWKRVEPVKCG